MKKVYLLKLILIFFAAQLSAQEVLNESFDGGTYPAEGWLHQKDDGNSKGWQCLQSSAYSAPSPHTGVNFVEFDSYYTSKNKGASLTTPMISESLEKGYVLEFYSVVTKGSSGLHIDFSSTNGLSWTEDILFIESSAGETEWTKHTVDLSDFLPKKNIKIRFRAVSSYGYGKCSIALDDIRIFKPSAMSFSAIELSQPNLGIVPIGSTDNSIMAINIKTEGALNPLRLDQLFFNTTGTTLDTDISEAKLYFTGSSGNFSNSNLVGNVDKPADSFSVTSLQNLNEGDNYFWLVYDISTEAQAGNVIDAQCLKAMLSGVEHMPSSTSPDGNRVLKNAYLMQEGNNSLKVNAPTAFYDDGGLTGNYSKPFDGLVVFQPKDENCKVQIDFTTFKTNSSQHYLEIYNGNSTASTKFGKYSYAKNPGLLKSTSADGCLTVKFYANPYSSQADGWEAEVSNYTPQLMAVESVIANQNSKEVKPGDKKAEILALKITSEGLLNPLSLQNVEFNLAGCTDFREIEKLYIIAGGANTSSSSSTNQILAEIGSITETVAINLSEKLIVGDNNFWLVADLKNSAKHNNTIDASINKLNISGVDYTPSNADPAGNLLIQSVYKMENNLLITTENAVFYDTGGAEYEYDSDFDGFATIKPLNAGNKIQIEFVEFALNSYSDCSDDFVEIYNGENKSAPKIATYCGTTLPPIIKSTATDGSLCFYFKSDYDSWDSSEEAGWKVLITEYTPQPMSFVSSESILTDNKSVCRGTVDNAVIGINVKTLGSLNPLNIEGVKIDTKSVPHILKAKVYYTGKSNTFNTSQKLAESREFTNLITFACSQQLETGDNYFWLAYDIAADAEIGSRLPAECVQITIEGETRNNTQINAQGRLVGNVYQMLNSHGNIVNVGEELIFTDDGGKDGKYSKPFDANVLFTPVDPNKRVKMEFIEFNVGDFYGTSFEAFSGNSTEDDDRIAKFAGDDLPAQVKSISEEGSLNIQFETSQAFQTRDGWVAKVSCYTPRSLEVSAVTPSQTNRDYLKRDTKDQLIMGVELNITGEKGAVNLSKVKFSTAPCSSANDIARAKLYYTNEEANFKTAKKLGEVINKPNGDFEFDFEDVLINKAGKYYFWLCFDIERDAIPENTVDVNLKSLTANNAEINVENGNPIGRRVIRKALAGEYSISNNPNEDADFPSLKNAIDALCYLGITSKVNFKISDGIYAEQLEIPEITGASAHNTITFESASGDNTKLIIHKNGTPDNQTLIKFNGADYVTFKNMSLINKGLSFAKIVEIYNSANHNQFIGNIFDGVELTAKSYDDDKSLVVSSSSSVHKSIDNYNVFKGNVFKNGRMALCLHGIDAVSDFEKGLVIEANVFENQYFKSIYLNYQNDLLVKGNTFKCGTAYRDFQSFDLFQSKGDVKILANKFSLLSGSKYRDAIWLRNISATAESKILIANNFINLKANASVRGLFISNASYVDVFHNTIRVDGSSAYSKAIYLEKKGDSELDHINIKNNNLSVFNASYLIWSKVQATNFAISNNNYYSNDNSEGFIKYGDILAKNFDVWKTAYPDDTNSIHIDPGFTSETDLHISGTHLKFGIRLDEVTEDIDGDLRNAATPYMGADEVPDATFIGGYPKFDETTAVGAKLLLKSSAAGTAYVVVLPEGSDLPDETQIKAGKNIKNEGPIFANHVNVELEKESIIEITGLTEKTDYDVVVVEEKNNGNFSGVIRLKLSTLDITAPKFVEGTPKLKDITNSSFVVEADINEPGTIYYGVYAASITSVSVDDIISGNGAIVVGHNNSTKEKFIQCQNLSAATNYNLFMVAQDNQDIANVQSVVTKLSLKTLYGNSIKNFLAEGLGDSQVKLSWLQSEIPSDVMLVFSETNTFGRPVRGTTYQIDDVLTDGGQVIYSGKADNFIHAGLQEGKTYYYRAYTFNSGKEYSQYAEDFVVLKNDNWTILVYMDGDNNLEGNAILDINEMEAVNLPDNVNVIVQIDRNPGYDYSNDNWTETRRYKIVHDKDIKKISSIWLDEANPLGELNMGHPETLGDFVEWGVKTYPSKKTMLILWDHGGGWRSEQDNNFNLTKGVCWDDTNGNDYLEMREVASAMELAKNRSNKTINVLGFDVCLAAMTEVAYQVKDQVSDYFVFSQALEPGTGWDYDNWLSSLVSTPDISSLDLSRSVVSTYQDNYAGSTDVTLSAFDVTKIDGIKTAIDDFVITYAAHEVEANIINSAFDKSDLFSARKNYIDLGLFMNHCATYLNNTDSKTKAQVVKTLLDEAVVLKGNTGSFNEATGLNIYFHKYNDYEWNDYKAPYCNFADESNWKTFVKTYDKDGQAPLFIDGFPNAMNLSSTVFDLSVKSNKSGFAYFVILDDNAEMPTVSQVKAGQNSLGVSLEPNLKGKVNMTRYEIAKQAIQGLSEATDYDIYFVLEDEAGLCANAAQKFEVKTLDRNVATFDKLLLANDAFWNGSDNSGGFDNGGFHFPNYYSSMAWSGFAYSNRTDNTIEGIPGQYTAYAGGGAEGSKNYALAYVFGSLIRVDIDKAGEGIPVSGMYVTNNNFAVHSMLNGDAIAKKFGGDTGNDPDWFKLIVKGVDAQGHYTGEVEFYLADFRFDDNSKDYIVDKWKWLDLTPLGHVVKLEYRLASSDGGSEGRMNTPGYFCIDNLNGSAPVDRAPTVATPIADIIADENADDKIIDLSAVFTDADGDALSFEIVSNSNSELVSADINGSKLTLSFAADQFGKSTVTIKAIANGKSVRTQVNVKVTEVDFAPTVATPIADIIADENADDKIIDLSAVFTDADGDALSFEIVSNSNSELVSADINGSKLTLSFAADKFGECVVSIKAIANGKAVETSFAITVSRVTSVEELVELDFSIYPNPCVNFLHVKTENTIIDCIKLIDLKGHLVSVYEPNSNLQRLNMSQLPGGMYILQVQIGDEIFVRKIIKR